MSVLRIGVIGAGLGHDSRAAAQLCGAASVAELSGWVASVVTGVPAGASAWDGYAASMVSEAALEALRNRQPAEVRLEDRPGLYADDGRLVARGR